MISIKRRFQNFKWDGAEKSFVETYNFVKDAIERSRKV